MKPMTLKPLLSLVVLGFVTFSSMTMSVMAQEATPELEHITDVVLPPGLPFSEAVRVGDMVYVAGTIGVEPGAADAGEVRLVSGGLEAEARQTMDHISAILEAGGSSMERIIHCTVYLVDMDEWPAFNEIYQTYFEPPYPARTAAGVSALALGARVEVDCVAAAGREN